MFIVGGPSFVFTRYHEANRAENCQKLEDEINYTMWKKYWMWCQCSIFNALLFMGYQSNDTKWYAWTHQKYNLNQLKENIFMIIYTNSFWFWNTCKILILKILVSVCKTLFVLKVILDFKKGNELIESYFRDFFLLSTFIKMVSTTWFRNYYISLCFQVYNKTIMKNNFW